MQSLVPIKKTSPLYRKIPLKTKSVPLSASPATAGNIDLAKQPIVKNADGTTSTVRSISINEDGREILLPTVSHDGTRILSDEEAIEQYHKSGKHLGIFGSPEAATKYADQLHKDYESGKIKLTPSATSRPVRVDEDIYAPAGVPVGSIEERGQLNKTPETPPLKQIKPPPSTPSEVLEPFRPVGEAIVDAAKSLATPEMAALVAAGMIFPPSAIAAGLIFLPQMLDQGADVYAMELEADRKAKEATGEAKKKAEDEAKYWRTTRYILATGIGAGTYGLGKVGLGRGKVAPEATAPKRLQAAPEIGTPVEVAPRALPAAPPVRGGRVTADIIGPEGPPVYTGTPKAQRIPLKTGIRGELSAAPEMPASRLLPPSPAVELPGGGVMTRGAVSGQPGSIPAPRQATVIPIKKGVLPRYAKPKTATAETVPAAAQPAASTLTPKTIEQNKIVEEKPQTFLQRKTVIDNHPIWSLGEAKDPLKDFEGTLERASGNAPKVALDYLDRLRETAKADVPGALPHIAKAKTALASGKDKQFALAAEAARKKISTAYHEQVTVAAAAKAGIELPKATSKAPTVTQFDHIIDNAAEIRMKEWAEDARHAQERLSGRRGESAATQQSNVEGKAIEEAADALANQVGRSLGAKEGSPLASFTQAPSALIASIYGTRGALRDQIKAAFREVLVDTEGREAQEFLDKTPDAEKAGLFGNDFITFEKGGTKPLLGATEAEAATLAGAGRRPELLKEGKTFDESRLVESELFQGKGGPQQFLGTDARAEAGVTKSVDPADALFDATEPLPHIGEISFDFSSEKGSGRIGAITRPIHNIRQAIFEVAEKYGEAGLSKAGDAIGSAFEKMTPVTVQSRLESLFGQRPERYKAARRELRGAGSAIREQSEVLGRDLMAAMPTAESRILAHKLVQNKATPQEVVSAINDPTMQAAVKFVKDDFMRLGEAIVMEGVGKYSKLTPEARTAVVDAMKGKRKIESLDPELRSYVESGIAKYFGEYLPRLYRSREAKAAFKKHGVSMKRVRNEFDRLKHRREDLSPEVREAMGEITEIIEPAVKGIYQEEMMLVKNTFFKKIAADSSLTAKEPASAPPIWKTLPESELLGPLSGKTVHPSVHRDLTEMMAAPSEAAKVFQTVNRLIKKSKTVYNPATQVRNYGSNWISRDAIGGMDATSQGYRDMQAFRSIVSKNHHFKEARKTGLFATDYATLDLSKIQMDEVPKVPKPGQAGAVDAVARMFEAIGKIDDAATWAYRMGDDVPKLGMYLWLRQQKGMTPAQAVKRTLDVLPDYSEVMPIVEKARKSLLGPTFVSFASIQPPRFARSVLKHPLRAGKWVVIGAIVEQMLVNQALKTQDEVDAEKKEMPEYMKPKGIAQPFMPLPFKDSYGRSLYLDLTYTLPFGDVMEGSGAFGLPPVFDIGILPRALLDVSDNYNNFGSYLRGEPVAIYADTDTPEEKAKKVGVYLGAALLPSMTPKIGYGYRRLESSIMRKPSYYGDAPQDVPLAIAQVLGGFKTVAVDADAEAAARVREVNGKISAIDGRLRAAASNQSLSDTEREKLIDSLVGQKERVIAAYEAR